MGLARWIQNRDLKSDLKIIRSLDSDDRELLLDTVGKVIAKLHVRVRVPAGEIFDSEIEYNPAIHQWGPYPFMINRFRMGVAHNQEWFIAAGIVLHSMRAILDYELNRHTSLLHTCKVLWYELTQGDMEMIPVKFK